MSNVDFNAMCVMEVDFGQAGEVSVSNEAEVTLPEDELVELWRDNRTDDERVQDFAESFDDPSGAVLALIDFADIDLTDLLGTE